MSSNEDTFDVRNGKRRRVERACDLCRRRKIRCDSSDMDGDKCSACYEAGIDCTYIKAPPKRTRPESPPSGYVASLEARLDESLAVIRGLRNDLAAAHFKQAANGLTRRAIGNSNRDIDSVTASSGSDTPDVDIGPAAVLDVMCKTLRALGNPQPTQQADDFMELEIGRRCLGIGPGRRFIGRSSGAVLVRAAIDLKAEVKREEEEVDLAGIPRQNPSPPHRVPWASRRAEYWTMKSWEVCTPEALEPPHWKYSFPSPPILAHLTELYFTHANMYIPILHQPTFERAVATDLHLRDNDFAATVLLVCAIGSRWSDDPAAMGIPSNNAYMSSSGSNSPRLACGWAWFNQVPHQRAHLFRQTTLHVLQYYCLATRFLEGSTIAQVSWTLIGVGLRLAQDVGAHRGDARVREPSVERELWKRAFWALVYMDRMLSSSLGRACVVQYTEIDLDPLLEVDDEYWEHPDHPFCQPPGVPARVAFFNTLLRLNHILASGLKLLYSPMKMRAVFKICEGWEEACVEELDAALGIWRDQIPEHLRWDPTRADAVFFDQSVALHCAYSQVQILFHRSFIPMIRKAAPTALPSLAICTGAARACANMVDLQRRRKGDVGVAGNMAVVFTSCLVLLLNVLSERRRGRGSDPEREMADVHKCMEVLLICEDRWAAAGLYRDILAELASVGHLPLPQRHESDVGQWAPVAFMNDTASSLSSSAAWLQPLALSPEDMSRMMLNPGTFGADPMELSTFAPALTPPHRVQSNDAYAYSNKTLSEPQVEASGYPDYTTPDTMDLNTLALWTSAPTGLEIDDWETYFSYFGDSTQGL